MGISKVLIANRGEIAVRVVRAAADAGLPALRSTPTRTTTRSSSRLPTRRTPWAARRRPRATSTSKRFSISPHGVGADAIHPGYGFLAENASFAKAVLDAGLTWIGPPPAAIEALGDKVRARHIAQKVGAPLVPGTPDPVPDADAVIAFATEHGLPIAIKAAFGGGGRGLKVAREMSEIAELFESATREAVTAFGRGECFVERYLDRPRHVETQCLADSHGNVVVVSTRDCSLQRRHQKLVEEAPAPFLSTEQMERALRLLQGDSCRSRLRGRGNLRVPRRPGRHHLLPRGEYPAPGRAPGLGGGHGPRPRTRDVPDRRRRAAGIRRPRRHAGTRSSSGSTPRTRAATSCPRPAPSRRGDRPPGPAFESTRATSAG